MGRENSNSLTFGSDDECDRETWQEIGTDDPSPTVEEEEEEGISTSKYEGSGSWISSTVYLGYIFFFVSNGEKDFFIFLFSKCQLYYLRSFLFFI